jgi:hypothetical protein
MAAEKNWPAARSASAPLGVGLLAVSLVIVLQHAV